MSKVLGSLLIGVMLLLTACTHAIPEKTRVQSGISSETDGNPNQTSDFTDADLQKIYFAGGCFWGVEAFFEGIPGVYDVTAGYANGDGENPTYEDVIKGQQGFAETVEVIYDPKQVSLDALLDYLFMVIDPTAVNQQGNDVGIQYRTGIYYVDEADEEIIQAHITEEQKDHTEKIATEVEPLQNYYLAEEFHQDYLVKNPNGYCHIDLGILDDINFNSTK